MDRDTRPAWLDGHEMYGPGRHWSRSSRWNYRRELRGRRRGPIRRVADDRQLGGVAAGLARFIGRDVTVIRVLFLIFGLPGFGLVPYFACWLLIKADGEDDTIAARALSDRRTVALAVAVASVVELTMIVISWLGITWFNSVSWGYVVASAGLVAVARHGSAAERDTLRRLAAPLLPTGAAEGAGSRRWLLARAAVAVALLGAGLGLLLYNMHPIGTASRSLSGVVLVVAAIVVLLLPWWVRVGRDLVTERQALARAEERVDMAARLHDSVLQTLALIQRQAENPQQVVQLARAQERELRGWLFEGAVPGAFDAEVTHLAAGIQRVAEEVESRHGVPVDAVTVGDAPLDKHLEALLEATREAAVNAAKWSGAPMISVFAEADGDTVSAYVRDRGRGFDPDSVPPDRKGLSESITARMARHGGSARIRSAPGEGAEVTLVMPRVTRQPAAHS
jgi:signal transduction histidine kinase